MSEVCHLRKGGWEEVSGTMKRGAVAGREERDAVPNQPPNEAVGKTQESLCHFYHLKKLWRTGECPSLRGTDPPAQLDWWAHQPRTCSAYPVLLLSLFPTLQILL